MRKVKWFKRQWAITIGTAVVVLIILLTFFITTRVKEQPATPIDNPDIQDDEVPFDNENDSLSNRKQLSLT